MVPEEQDTLPFTDSALAGLNPLAPSGAVPHGLDESHRAIPRISAIVSAHDRLDSFSGLVGVVEWDAADIVVQDVCLDDAMEEMAADEAKLTVDSRSGTANKVPRIGGVMGQGGVGVLQESDGN